MSAEGLAVRIVGGPAVVLDRANIDTDVIINIKRCVTLQRGEYGPWALEAMRFLPDGTPDPACPLNVPPGDTAKILIVGDNFGCGSSRELAVWALHERGIRVVIAPSFGDIFFGNCFENFLLPIRLPEAQHVRLAAEVKARGEAVVDLQRSTITCGSLELAFEIDATRREMLLKGQRMIDFILARRAEITAFEARVAAERPWLAQEFDRHIRQD